MMCLNHSSTLTAPSPRCAILFSYLQIPDPLKCCCLLVSEYGISVKTKKTSCSLHYSWNAEEEDSDSEEEKHSDDEEEDSDESKRSGSECKSNNAKVDKESAPESGPLAKKDKSLEALDNLPDVDNQQEEAVPTLEGRWDLRDARL